MSYLSLGRKGFEAFLVLEEGSKSEWALDLEGHDK
jgi:hypothetical protein